MTIEQMIADLPLAYRFIIILLLLPAAKNVFDIIMSVVKGGNDQRILALENERDESLSQSQMQTALADAIRESNHQMFTLFKDFRDELNNVTSAIREAATINRETDTDNRKVLENNNALIGQFTVMINGLSNHLDSMGKGLHEVAEVNKQVLKSNQAVEQSNKNLHEDVRKTLNNYDLVLTTIDTVRSQLNQTVDKQEFGKFRSNMIELFDGLEEAVILLSTSTKRNSDTLPLDEKILDQLVDPETEQKDAIIDTSINNEAK